MKIIAGLGNPGGKYAKTRHNAGFMAVDFILDADADKYMAEKPSHEFKSEVHTVGTDGSRVIFLKPQTYMNDSGQALRMLADFYKLNPTADLLVIHDEVDLPFGEIRTTPSSSSAGHKGVQSIIDVLGTQDFFRVRIGVETRESKAGMPTDAFVLENFTGEELEKLQNEILPKVRMEINKFLQI